MSTRTSHRSTHLSSAARHIPTKRIGLGLLVIGTLTFDALTVGCSSRTCTLARYPGISLEVRANGADVCDAHVTVSEGAFRQEVKRGAIDPCAYFAANERVGTYVIEVRKPGYLTARREGVSVSKEDDDDCHVTTTHLTIELEPDPNAAPDAGVDSGP